MATVIRNGTSSPARGPESRRGKLSRFGAGRPALVLANLLICCVGRRGSPTYCNSQPPTRATAPENDTPRVIEVPAPLQQRTSSVEASGIAWCRSLGRYLVVSDDVGLKTHGTRHAPWLFATDTAGKLDDEPVPLLGIDSLNDPEAITAGPEGTFFITTSHSPDRKGRTPPNRRILLHARPEGRALRILGRVDLTEARDRDGRELLASGGLDEGGRIDIEALAFRDDALYIGFKSPLTPRGGAIILRLAAPVAALGAGRIPAGTLIRFAEVALEVVGPAGPVAQGLADMLFLPDGSMVLLGNSPKGLSADDGGALWWLAHPRSALPLRPTLLRRYSGLTPEGVTVGADGSSLVIVFDRKSLPPMWTRRPLPRLHP